MFKNISTYKKTLIKTPLDLHKHKFFYGYQLIKNYDLLWGVT